MMKFWNRLVKMPSTRLTKKIFLWDALETDGNWTREIKEICNLLQINNVVNNLEECDINAFTNSLQTYNNSIWKRDIVKKPKIRTYIKFKEDIGSEAYLTNPRIPKYKRSLLAQLRTGTLQLVVETGRHRN